MKLQSLRKSLLEGSGRWLMHPQLVSQTPKVLLLLYTAREVDVDDKSCYQTCWSKQIMHVHQIEQNAVDEDKAED